MSRQETDYFHDKPPEPPKWQDKETFQSLMKSFVDSETPRIIEYFKKVFPRLDVDEAQLAAQLLATMYFLGKHFTLPHGDIKVRTTRHVPEDLEAITQPIIELDGTNIEDIIDVPDHQLEDILFNGATIFINVNQIVNRIHHGTFDLQKKDVEELMIEEIAHCFYFEWASREKKRWGQLLEEQKYYRQKMDLQSEFAMDFDEKLKRLETEIEQHADEWKSSYRQMYHS